MAGSLAKEAHIRVAFSAAAHIQHLLSSLDTDPFFIEVLKSANHVLKDIDLDNSCAMQTPSSAINVATLIDHKPIQQANFRDSEHYLRTLH